MGVDIEALRRKMVEIKERQTRSGGVDFWQPKDGRNLIRILPAKEGQEFYSEAKLRYNVGVNKKVVTVPLDSNSGNCPIHKYVDDLFKSKDPDDEKLAKRMRMVNRYYFNIIDCSLEKTDDNYGKVFVFGCGTTIFTDIIGIMTDPDYGDITDEHNGFDVIINKTGTGLDTEYKTNARPKQTPIPIDDWKEKLHDLEKIATPRSYKQRAQILAGEEVTNDDEDDNKTVVYSTNQPKVEVKEKEYIGGEAEESGDDSDDIEAEIQRVLNQGK